MVAACATHLFLLDLITLITFGETYLLSMQSSPTSRLFILSASTVL